MIMPYRRLRLVHLAVAVMTGLPLLILSLSGALLVYGKELDRLLEPSLHYVQPAGQPLSYSAVVEQVGRQMPEVRIWSIGVGEEPGDAWSAWLAKGAGVLHIDPYTGEVLAHRGSHASFNGVLTALHRWLLVDGQARPWVRHAISAAALLLIVQMLVGIWLWSLPPRPLKRLALRRRGRVGLMRLHQLAGLVSALLLLVVAFTGMSLYWHAPTRAIVEWLSGERIREQPAPDLEGLGPIRDLDAAIARGEVQFPEARLRYFRLPQKPGDVVVLGLGHSDLGVVSRVWVGDDPVRVLAVRDGREANVAEWLWHIRLMVHMGDFAGPVVRALWVVVALLPAGFVVTGTMLYLGRRKPKAAAARAAAARA